MTELTQYTSKKVSTTSIPKNIKKSHTTNINNSNPSTLTERDLVVQTKQVNHKDHESSTKDNHTPPTPTQSEKLHLTPPQQTLTTEQNKKEIDKGNKKKKSLHPIEKPPIQKQQNSHQEISTELKLNKKEPLNIENKPIEAVESTLKGKNKKIKKQPFTKKKGIKKTTTPPIASKEQPHSIIPSIEKEDSNTINNKKMLISIIPGEQVEVAISDDEQLLEYFIEMTHHEKIRGNIYKGVINNIDTNLQAAFVNYGNVKNGFLQIDEVHPEYYLQPYEATKIKKYPPIQKVLKAGQEILVQVVKEPTGSKGAFLTTWLSLAGRFLVLTPGQEQIGISRKVEDEDERNRLRELIKGLEPGSGLGAIVRTVSVGTSKTTLQKDLSFLKRVWKEIRKKATTEKSPHLIFQEPGLATRAVRDYLADDITEIWVDDSETAHDIQEITTLLFPRKTCLVHVYENNKETLWEHFKLNKQIAQVHSREVAMPSGGRLVFDQTEALMAIDINSGRIAGKTNFESMAYRTNMEAATTIAQQLRLRDVGGQIVIDFIEMKELNHCRDVEKELQLAMKADRARHDVGKMSSFGLLQIVRQRTGSSAISITQEPCPHCQGTGQRRNIEWQAVQVLRELHKRMQHTSSSGKHEYTHTLDQELGLYILNHKRERLLALEQEFGLHLDLRLSLSKE